MPSNNIRRPDLERPCRQCGTLFWPFHDTALFCGRPCMTLSQKRHQTVACKACGTSFETRVGTHAASYCSPACRAQRPVPVDVRFWKYVDKNGPIPEHAPELGPCWLWTSNIVAGYGTLGTWSRETGRGTVKAHRLALEMKLGRPLLPGKLALHHCDNRRCVRDTHLYEGDNRDNAADAVERDRYLRGERNPKARLTDIQADEIRELYDAGARQVDLASMYGVNQGTISRITRGAGY